MIYQQATASISVRARDSWNFRGEPGTKDGCPRHRQDAGDSRRVVFTPRLPP